jgi:hypothetical protein
MSIRGGLAGMRSKLQRITKLGLMSVHTHLNGKSNAVPQLSRTHVLSAQMVPHTVMTIPRLSTLMMIGPVEDLLSGRLTSKLVLIIVIFSVNDTSCIAAIQQGSSGSLTRLFSTSSNEPPKKKLALVHWFLQGTSSF